MAVCLFPRFVGSFLALLCLIGFVRIEQCDAQTYGIELHNSTMPASGALAGTSFSRPQDLQSAIYGNPATTTQYHGTVVGFGGAFIEATINVNQATPLPLLGVTPYSAKSDTPPSLLGNIGVVHNTELMGNPVTLGMGFFGNAGAGVDFRPEPGSNGTHASYLSLDLVNSVAVNLTERLSVGTSLTAATSILDGPFVDTSSSQSDYALRYTLGANYELGNGISIGGFWQSKKDHKFDNVVRFAGGPYQDVQLDHPTNYGFGVANRCLMNGRLLLAVDVLYKEWSETDFFRALYDDQWVLQMGGQYALTNRTKFRMGYAFNEDATLDQVPGTIGGVVPIGGIPAVQYIQGQFAAINQHRLTGGFGVQEIVPGVDFDMSVGGMFDASKSFGATTASVESYWVSFGFTWRRGACAPCGCDCESIAANNMSGIAFEPTDATYDGEYQQ